ncbi:hypothetical protein G9A89_008833 [Geosiphon pyriformis]|nr:hypothetical protein G9A89_008833 [Geosiphon pyriformis]
MRMPAPPKNVSDALHYEQQDHHSHSLPDCISQGGIIAEWQPNTYNQNAHVRVHMPDGSDKFFPNVKKDHLQLYLNTKPVVDSQETYYDSSATMSRDASPSADEDYSDDEDDYEMQDLTRQHQNNQPLFLNFTSELAPQEMAKKKSKEKKQLQYRVNGVNILNRNSLDMQTAMERLKRRRENHNNVERKRRNNINNTIFEISLLMPVAYTPGAKPNKGSILRRAVEYIKNLQTENETMRAELNSNKGISLLTNEKSDATVTNYSITSTTVTTVNPPSSTSVTHSSNDSTSHLTFGNQTSIETTSHILPPPSSLTALESKRLKVEPLIPSSPNSPLIFSGGKNSSENVILPPISAELTKEFMSSSPASSPLHASAASFHGRPPSQANLLSSRTSGATSSLPLFNFLAPNSTLSTEFSKTYQDHDSLTTSFGHAISPSKPYYRGTIL